MQIILSRAFSSLEEIEEEFKDGDLTEKVKLKLYIFYHTNYNVVSMFSDFSRCHTFFLSDALFWSLTSVYVII